MKTNSLVKEEPSKNQKKITKDKSKEPTKMIWHSNSAAILHGSMLLYWTFTPFKTKRSCKGSLLSSLDVRIALAIHLDFLRA